MLLTNWISDFGRYVLLMKKVFTKPDRWNMFGRQYLHESGGLVINSIGIIGIISLFIGAVSCIQIQKNLDNPFLPQYLIGFATREMLMLEFSSAIMCLILAGKVGSNIASEIGTMRVTEQIDAMEIMGVNSANYLILPKVCAVISLMPILVILSISLGLVGGGILCMLTGTPTVDDYVSGIQFYFDISHIDYTIFAAVHWHIMLFQELIHFRKEIINIPSIHRIVLSDDLTVKCVMSAVLCFQIFRIFPILLHGRWIQESRSGVIHHRCNPSGTLMCQCHR